MKLRNLILSAVAAGSALCAAAAEPQVVLFDFHNPADLGQFTYSPMSLDELRAGKYLNESSNAEKNRCYLSGANWVLILSGDVISKDGVGFEMQNPNGIYKDYPRFFFGSETGKVVENPTAADYYSDARWYQKQSLVFTAPAGKKITKIVMDCSAQGDKLKAVARDNSHTIVETDGGAQSFEGEYTNSSGVVCYTQNIWEADSDTSVSTVKYTAEDDSPTQMAYKISVTIEDASDAAVEGIEADANVPARWYDINGIECRGARQAGLYIVRQGAKTRKVIVK